MGLDISAYSHLKLTEPHEVDDDCFDELGHILAYAYSGFARSYEGLADANKDDGRFIGNRCYELTPESDAYGFRAGSYGGYNAFRAALAEVGLQVDPQEVWEHPEKHENGPFFLLINFADNEGCIGSIAARRLLGEFRANRALFVANFPDWAEKYDDWTRACELAADDGMISFH